MRAVVASAYGGPDVLSVIELPTPEPGPGQVRVDVRAAGVNPWDHKVYGGAIGFDPTRLPMPIGSECAGVVSAVGPDVSAWSVGDEVIAYPVVGAYAEQVLVSGGDLVAKPANLSFEQASGLLLTGATAVHALTAVGVTGGETVLVHGASGGVGLAVVQVARHRGARVIATAGERHHEALRTLGAEPVAYGPGLQQRVESIVSGVDAAIDCVGTDEALEVSLALVDPARIVTIANFAGAQRTGIKAIGGGPGADPGTAIRSAARAELARLAEQGAVRVFIAGTFGLDQAAEAHALVASGRAPGKLAILGVD